MDIGIHMAPLQGFTDVFFRQLFEKYYGGVDVYYTPFIRMEHSNFRMRDLRDIAVEGQDKLRPQILPADVAEFEQLVEKIASYGYQKIDINMGCPFPPVTGQGRGCALLNMPEKASQIMHATEKYQNIEFSVKMRLGFVDTTQWTSVIDAINDANLSHVTAHARYGKQQYKGECDMSQFAEFLSACRHRVIYNGDVTTVDGAEAIIQQNPTVAGLMIGRGLLSNLNLARQIKGLAPQGANAFQQLHSELVAQLQDRMDNDVQVVDRMRPYWEYLFPNTDRKLLKKIKKAHKLTEYNAAVAEICHSLIQ